MTITEMAIEDAKIPMLSLDILCICLPSLRDTESPTRGSSSFAPCDSLCLSRLPLLPPPLRLARLPSEAADNRHIDKQPERVFGQSTFSLAPHPLPLPLLSSSSRIDPHLFALCICSLLSLCFGLDWIASACARVFSHSLPSHLQMTEKDIAQMSLDDKKDGAAPAPAPAPAPAAPFQFNFAASVPPAGSAGPSAAPASGPFQFNFSAPASSTTPAGPFSFAPVPAVRKIGGRYHTEEGGEKDSVRARQVWRS
jgi:hypothetical protein